MARFVSRQKFIIMADISFITAQNTVLVQNKSSLGDRILATVLDGLFFFAYFILGLFIVSAIGIEEIFWVVYMLPVFFYSLIMEAAFHGQTFGKRIMKLKVIHCEGRDVPFTSYLLRWLLRIVDIWMFSGCVAVVVIIISKKGQRLGDMAANSLVVSLKDNQAKLSDISFYKAEIKEEEIQFPHVSLLYDSDIALIRDVLAYGKESEYSGPAAKMILQTSDSMKKKLAIESNMIPVKFLEQLITDYYNLHK